MKIAKKVLALVIALAMVASFACVAFAADKASIVVVPGEVDADGYLAVTVVAKNAVGLTSADLVLTYDAKVLAYDSAEDGADAAQVGNTKSNSFSAESNGSVPGELQYAFYFKTSLTTAEEFAADASRGKTVEINDKAFECAVLYFEVLDADATATEIKVTGSFNTLDGANGTVNASASAVLKEVVETTTAAPETTTVEEVSSSVVANPDTGDGGTGAGDNMALAAAFGVVALAGAAFVITKKRK